MKLIQNNPYRIAGIPSDISEKELLKRKNKIKRYNEIRRQVPSDYDFSFLPTIERNNGNIPKAFAAIQQDKDKVIYSLFWFLSGNNFDQTALNYLKTGNREKALEIWSKVTNGKAINNQNYSCFNNIGTLYLSEDSENNIKKGIEVKIKLIESDCFESFVDAVADETYSINRDKQIKLFIDRLLPQLKNDYSTSQTIALFDNCNGTTQKYLSEKFMEEPIHNIERQIDKTKRKRKENKGNADQYGNALYINTKQELSLLKSIVDSSNLQYKMLADNVAKELLQCSIDYFNENQEQDEDGDYLETAMKLAKLAKKVAVKDITKERIKDSIETLEGMKNRELNQAIALLQSVKGSYEKNKRKIEAEVRELEETDPEILLGLKSINRDAVRQNIKNSINWNKVNDLLRNVLPDESLKKLKTSSNNELKSEFMALARWLKDHSQSNSLITRIIGDYKKIPPRLTFKILSSEITNTDNKPLYTKFIRYIGLSLDLQVKEQSTITFYLKYIDPDGRVDQNSKTSPVGYTKSETKTLSPRIKKVEFASWGKSNECTFDIGKHRIELYVDEYMIHSKEFDVDIAPSDQIKKEISIAEKKLKRINKTDYYKSKIESAQNKMNEIKKFKFFRLPAKKRKEMEIQQHKIEKLIEKSESKKKKNVNTQKEKIYKLKMELSAAKH